MLFVCLFVWATVTSAAVTSAAVTLAAVTLAAVTLAAVTLTAVTAAAVLAVILVPGSDGHSRRRQPFYLKCLRFSAFCFGRGGSWQQKESSVSLEIPEILGVLLRLGGGSRQ